MFSSQCSIRNYRNRQDPTGSCMIIQEHAETYRIMQEHARSCSIMLDNEKSKRIMQE
jgi:hypothetical protein